MKEIARLYALAEELIRRPRHRTAEVALVIDPKSAYGLTDGEGMAVAQRLISDVTTELHYTGAPFDTIFLSQLAPATYPPPFTEGGPRVPAKLPPYKLLIFLNTLVLNDRQIAEIQQMQRGSGPAMLWLWLPGLLGPDGMGVERASRLTGFDLELISARLPCRVEISDSPVFASLRAENGRHVVLGDGFSFGPVLAVRDGQRIGFAPGTQKCLLATRANGRQTFLATPYASRQLLAAILENAGVHRYDASFDDVVRGDSSLLVVHTKQGGPREIKLPTSGRLYDALTGEPIGRGKQISVTLPPSTTAIWKITSD